MNSTQTGVIFFPAFDWAISPTHPEREERLLYTRDQLREEGVFDLPDIREYKPDIAAEHDVRRVHFCFPDVESVVTDSHMVSAGGALKAARLVMEGECRNAFALVRPPGHHAMKSVHGNRGFCNINNEAVMIEYIREHYGIKKIAIVDTDCHHGDGTQDIYWHDPNVLFISLHQDGRTLYPGSGFPNESGGPNAPGRIINIPLPPGTSDWGFLYTMEKTVLPILEDFQPDIIINSAGQDNHYTDPITNMNFTAQGYARLNQMLKPDICVLEGGYSIQGALPYVNLGIILALAGKEFGHVREPDYDAASLKESEEARDFIRQICEIARDVYFKKKNPAPGSEGFISRSREIYYDTDGISEQQTEHLRVCPDCAGTIFLETESSRNPLSLGIEIPFNSCDGCFEAGMEKIDEVQKTGRIPADLSRGGERYDQAVIINRRDKVYVNF
jgi:acetoin utilization deacetylase AcuC-like enzyme